MYILSFLLLCPLVINFFVIHAGMLRYGRESRRIPQRALSEICRDLRCTNVPARPVRQTGSGLVSLASHPALEGSTCGEGMVFLNVAHFSYIKSLSYFCILVVSERSVLLSSPNAEL